MEHSPTGKQPLLVCALEYERSKLLRHGVGKLAQIDCCGPSSEGVERWAQADHPKKGLVILCGVAGALDHSLQPGDARIVTQVIDAESGRTWSSILGDAAAQKCNLPATSLASCRHAVGTPEEKSRLREQTQAGLVDTESAAFARIAVERSWLWMIVRGVSDSASQTLPTHMTGWVDASGRTQVMHVLSSLVRRPWLMVSVVRAARDSSLAMRNVEQILRKILSGETAR